MNKGKQLRIWHEKILGFGFTGSKGREQPQIVSHTPNTRTRRAGRGRLKGSICELSGALNTTLGAWPCGYLGHLPGVCRNGRAQRTQEGPHTRRPQVVAQERLNSC